MGNESSSASMHKSLHSSSVNPRSRAARQNARNTSNVPVRFGEKHNSRSPSPLASKPYSNKSRKHSSRSPFPQSSNSSPLEQKRNSPALPIKNVTNVSDDKMKSSGLSSPKPSGTKKLSVHEAQLYWIDPEARKAVNSLSNHKVPSPKHRRMSSKANRYEGLAPPELVTPKQGSRTNSLRNYNTIVSSLSNSTDDYDLPPPPPPPDDEDELEIDFSPPPTHGTYRSKSLPFDGDLMIPVRQPPITQQVRQKSRVESRSKFPSLRPLRKKDKNAKKPKRHQTNLPLKESSEVESSRDNTGGVLDELDISFVDYTVVPLLLRGGFDYEIANKFGDTLKTHYSGKKIREIMGNPFELFSVLDIEKTPVSDAIKFKIVDDAFWKQSHNLSEGDKRRTSFVFYKAEAASKNVRNKSLRPKAGDSRNRRLSSRHPSMKQEFMQERALGPGEREKSGVFIDMKEVRNSLTLFAVSQEQQNALLALAGEDDGLDQLEI